MCSLIRQHPCDLRHVDSRYGRRSLEAALALPRLAAQDVLLERLAPQKLPVLRPLEALRRAAVRLEFDLLRFFRHRVPVVLPRVGFLVVVAVVFPPSPPSSLRKNASFLCVLLCFLSLLPGFFFVSLPC